MSDVMKQVVQEIMQRNKTIVSRKVDSPPNKPNPSLANIKRPNYQRLKEKERLAFTKNKQLPVRSGTIANRNHQLSPMPKQFNEESISALSSLSLVQGKVPSRNSFSVSTRSRQDKAKVIGKTRNGGFVWFFPQLEDKLRNSFGRALSSEAVGVVQMPECMPSQLLLIDEVVQQNPGIKFSVTWAKDEKSTFTAELFDDDPNRLEKIMNDMYQKLNRRSLKSFETYTLSSPSPWLKSQLNITGSDKGIAFVEGISYYTSILLMDHLLKNSGTSDFQFEIAHKFLLLSGNVTIITQLVNELKSNLGQVISSG